MEKFTQKWAVAALLEDIPEGAEFHSTEFPLHITLAGVFSINKHGKQLADELTKILREQTPFTIEASVQDMFGPNKDIAVMRITKTDELMELYKKIYTWLINGDAVYLEPQYQGDGYLPHSTIQKSGVLYEGERRLIKSVSLVDLYPNHDGHMRKIFKTVDLQH